MLPAAVALLSARQDPLDEHRATPERSLDQRMDALGRANEVRALRAQLKRDLKAGRVSIGALLLNQPPYLKTAKVFDMLLALPKVGRVKATKILHSCRVSPARQFGGLSEHPLAGRLVASRSISMHLRSRGSVRANSTIRRYFTRSR